MRTKGFTLVELAIVITIIGLLIGGVLKGQELLQNARITSAAAQFKSIDAAVITFKTTYRSLPGDIDNAGSFVPDCTGLCAVAGNRDGGIGPANGYDSEGNRFWLQLARAGLITGIDLNSTWTAGTLFAASFPVSPLDSIITIRNYSTPSGNVWFPEGLIGHYYAFAGKPSADKTTADPSVPNNVFAKLDLKVDDGKPWVGNFLMLHAACGPAQGAQAYDPNDKTLCWQGLKAGF